jgi:rod shape-determining protein MreD
VLFLAGVALVQSSLGQRISVAGIHPDLVLVCVMGWSFWRRSADSLTWAIVGGIWLDVLSAGPFGAMTVPLILVSLLVTRLGFGRVLGGYLVLPLLLAFPLSILYYLLYVAVLNLTGTPVPWVPTLAYVGLPASLLNAGVSFLILPLLHWLHQRSVRDMLR